MSPSAPASSPSVRSQSGKTSRKRARAAESVVVMSSAEATGTRNLRATCDDRPRHGWHSSPGAKSGRSGPQLDVGAASARKVPVLELHLVDDPLLAWEINHAASGVLVEHETRRRG